MAVIESTKDRAELNTILGAVPQAAQANSTAANVADLVTDFNALLVKLRAAGIIAP